MRAELKQKQEAELKQKMIVMKKEGKTVDEIKAFVLAEKKKMAAAMLSGGGSPRANTYTLQQLQSRPKECDQTKLESYLSDTDFNVISVCQGMNFQSYQIGKKEMSRKNYKFIKSFVVMYCRSHPS